MLLKDLLSRALDQDQSLQTLDYATVQTLEEIAQLKVGRASQQTKGILRFFYGKESLDYPYLELTGSARSWQEIKETKTAKVWTMPNPAYRWTEINYTLPENTETAQLRIVSTSGKEVFSYSLTKNIKNRQGMINLDVSDWTTGTYFILLLVNDDEIASNKFIVQH